MAQVKHRTHPRASLVASGHRLHEGRGPRRLHQRHGRAAEVLTVRLDPELEARLNELAEATGRSKSHYVRQAIEEFLEDRADYLLAISLLEQNQPTIGIAELRRELGI